MDFICMAYIDVQYHSTITHTHRRDEGIYRERNCTFIPGFILHVLYTVILRSDRYVPPPPV